MPHLHQFFVEPSDVAGDTVSLGPEEAHHALRVVRVKLGEEVMLFDGSGNFWRGEVRETSRRGVSIRVTDAGRENRPPTELTLLQAWLHTEKSLATLIQRCTELGVTSFRFFRAERSERAPAINTKWRRIAIESCKQTGRLWLPTFDTADGLRGALDGTGAPRLMASLQGPCEPLGLHVRGKKDVTVAIGPEGDWTDDELAHALGEGGCRPISLGGAALRSEVAAVTACTLIQYESGNLGPLASS